MQDKYSDDFLWTTGWILNGQFIKLKCFILYNLYCKIMLFKIHIVQVRRVCSNHGGSWWQNSIKIPLLDTIEQLQVTTNLERCQENLYLSKGYFLG